MTQRIAVFGGTFNPFGNHHQEIVRWLVTSGFDQVLVVPSAAHALKTELGAFVDRVIMAQMAVSELKDDGRIPKDAVVKVLSIEQILLMSRPPPIYTWDVLQEIRKNFAPEGAEIKFVIGPDVREELHRWKFVPEIEREFGFVEAPDLGIHSTKIREMVRDDDEQWINMVPGMVAMYIAAMNLYQAQLEQPLVS